MKTIADAPALDFWARHVDAMEWFHDNWWDVEPEPQLPHSLKATLSRSDLDLIGEILQKAADEQSNILTHIKSGVSDHLNASAVVKGKGGSLRSASWEFSLDVRERLSNASVGWVWGMLHTTEHPSQLRISMGLALKSANGREEELSSILSSHHVSRSPVGAAPWKMKPGRILLMDRPWLEADRNGAQTMKEVAEEFINAFSAISDVAWENILRSTDQLGRV